MKSASTEAATKKRIVLDIFVIVCVSLQISCFIVILIQIPAKGLIPGLLSYVFKIFSGQIKFFEVFHAVFVYNLII